jgi:hypothetical protein
MRKQCYVAFQAALKVISLLHSLHNLRALSNFRRLNARYFQNGNESFVLIVLALQMAPGIRPLCF